MNYFEPTKTNLRADDYNVNFINFLLTGTLIKISLFKKRLYLLFHLHICLKSLKKILKDGLIEFLSDWAFLKYFFFCQSIDNWYMYFTNSFKSFRYTCIIFESNRRWIKKYSTNALNLSYAINSRISIISSFIRLYDYWDCIAFKLLWLIFLLFNRFNF